MCAEFNSAVMKRTANHQIFNSSTSLFDCVVQCTYSYIRFQNYRPQRLIPKTVTALSVWLKSV